MSKDRLPRELTANNPAADASDENELVRRLVAGDHEAMAILFDRYYRMVMGVALRIVRDAGEAQDVTQIVFTEFYRKAELFDHTKGTLKTWLLQYAYGRSINRKKSLQAQNFYNRTEPEAADSVSRGGARLFGLEPHESARLIEQVLATLNERQQKVINMVYAQGMTIAEVAALTGESFGNVQHAYYRGIEKLRAYLEQADRRTAQEGDSKKSGSLLRRWKTSGQTASGKSEVKIVKARAL